MTTNQADGNNKQEQSEMSSRGQFDLRGKLAFATGGVGILGQHFWAGLAESGADVAHLCFWTWEFPFPRRENAVRAMSQFLGCNSGYDYAEGFRSYWSIAEK